MKEELIQQYPEMFTQPKFQYDWPGGWTQLVTDLVHEVAKTDSGVQILQIKEKFAGLRFYYSHGNEMVKKLVNEAENKSYSICQICGSNKAQPTTSPIGWMTTLCDRCNNGNESQIVS